MLIKEMFTKEIDRTINGVVQVGTSSEDSVVQDLTEYVVTNELQGHFEDFFETYMTTEMSDKAEMGVWISGFFGSGKSHLLEVLSYLLDTHPVQNQKAYEFFEDKINNPMTWGYMKKAGQLSAETIAFDIQKKMPGKKDETVILRTFERAFFDHLGYKGQNFKMVRLERYLKGRGELNLFKERYEEISGEPYESLYETIEFSGDDLVETLQDVLGWSDTAAWSWFDNTFKGERSIEDFVKDVKNYLKTKPENFRLVFMVDEIGQFIGSSRDLMLAMQSLTEEFGKTCEGQVWVIATSQENIDELTGVTGDDFSRILGRFGTKLKLASTDVDEMLQKRLLEKNIDSINLLKSIYAKNSVILENLYQLSDSSHHHSSIGYRSEDDFIRSYPFVPYQYRLIQDVFQQVRQQGHTGGSTSGGERSLISAFQAAAKSVLNQDHMTLVPLYAFYEGLEGDLEVKIQLVINRAVRDAVKMDGLEKFDVNVLKVLYMIRFIDHYKAFLDNIVMLMVDRMDVNTSTLKNKVINALKRLEARGYIARTGDEYIFLTDEEQQLDRKIRQMHVEEKQVLRTLMNIVFDDIYSDTKISHKGQNIPFIRKMDDVTRSGSNGSIVLNLITSRSDWHEQDNNNVMELRSTGENTAYVVLERRSEYFEHAENYLKAQSFLNNPGTVTPNEQRLINQRKEDNAYLRREVVSELEQAILNAEVVIGGRTVKVTASTAKGFLENVLDQEFNAVYTNIDWVQSGIPNDAGLFEILKGNKNDLSLDAFEQMNKEALNEVRRKLSFNKVMSLTKILEQLKAVPYGWRDLDILGLVAYLTANGEAYLKLSGMVLDRKNRKTVDCLRDKNKVGSITVIQAVNTDRQMVSRVSAGLRRYFNVMDISDEEGQLNDQIFLKFTKKKEEAEEILNQYSKACREYPYPGKEVIQELLEIYNEILSHTHVNGELIQAVDQVLEDLEEMSDEAAAVEGFFKSTVDAFDRAVGLIRKVKQESDQISGSETLDQMVQRLERVLKGRNIGPDMDRLSDFNLALNKEYGRLLKDRKKTVGKHVEEMQDQLEQMDVQTDAAKAVQKRAVNEFKQLIQSLDGLDSFTAVNAVAGSSESKYNDRRSQIENVNVVKKSVIKSKESFSSADEAMDVEPEMKTVNVSRITLYNKTVFKSEAEIDEYLEKIRQVLYSSLEYADEVRVR